MSQFQAYHADRIFTGDAWLSDHAVVVGNGIIDAVVSLSSLSNDVVVERFPGNMLAPAFIDLQIYGAYGRLLAVYPDADSLFKLNEYCNAGGAAFCMPTVATNTYETFHQCIDAVKDYWNKKGSGILGLHIEGPWINPAKRGAHVESLIHSPSVKEVADLLNYGKGVIKMITLAPEVCDKHVIDLILSNGIIISAGHSDASYEQAMNGFANGISMVTHLYNAMSPLQHRAPGLTGAALDHPGIRASIIPDGHHVDYAAIRIAKKIMRERLLVITDAVTETHKGYYQHELAGDKYVASGILSGSALTMNKAMKNLVDHCGIEWDEAIRMCSLYPAKAMGMEKELGKIEKGYRAAMVVLNDDIEVKGMIL